MPRVLVFNFFAGVMERGIPVYAHNLAECMRRVGLDPVELKCPSWFRHTPRAVRNVAFVVFEQFVAPVARVVLRCGLAVYPYNSTSIIDSLLGRSVLVVHDLIPNRRENLAARYICLTQAAHRQLGRPICAASAHTFTQLKRLAAFKRCSVVLWSNPFYSFESALNWRASVPRPSTSGRLRVLLCSGLSTHKDFGGALKLFTRSQVLRDAELRIFGFGDDSRLAVRRVQRLPKRVAERVQVLERLTLPEVIAEYTASDLVWVHSRSEGFGRCIVEGRLAGRPVVASDIGAFRKLVDGGVQLYDDDKFDAAVSSAIGGGPSALTRSTAQHALLEAAVSRVVGLYARGT